MDFELETIIKPLPTDEYLFGEEKNWRVKLPEAYKEFMKKYSGGVPRERCFTSRGREYFIDRFLCILSEYRTHKLGMYDVGVVITQIEDRLSDNPNLIGAELLPIVALFAGDFVCLDYRNSKTNPKVCVWSHEESAVDKPITYYTAENFESFLSMLYK